MNSNYQDATRKFVKKLSALGNKVVVYSEIMQHLNNGNGQLKVGVF